MLLFNIYHIIIKDYASILLFQIRYNIDTTFTIYRDIFFFDIKYVSKMHTLWQT